MSNQVNKSEGLRIGCNVFMDSPKYILHLLEHFLRRQHLVGSPKEGYVEPTFERLKQFLLQPIGLAQLPLDTIPLDRSFEVSLANGDHNAHHSHFVRHEDGTNRKGRDRLMAAAKEFLQSLSAAETLLFWKCVGADVSHLPCADGRRWQMKCWDIEEREPLCRGANRHREQPSQSSDQGFR